VTVAKEEQNLMPEYIPDLRACQSNQDSEIPNEDGSLDHSRRSFEFSK
jgi:hypothetical protein